jgi:hypothetical protein
MNSVVEKTRLSLAALLAGLFLLPVSASADSGFYIGGSFGNAAVEGDVGAFGLEDFDEDDSAYKAFLGYRLDLPMMILAFEGGYVNLGEPEFSGDLGSLTVEADGINLFALAGFEAGPIDLFVKAGYIAWDAGFESVDVLGNVESGSDDGSDLGYGLGLSFGLGPLEVRGEYEIYDIEDVDVSMISVGFSYLFD